MHALLVTHSNPGYFGDFERWVNHSLSYNGSKPIMREIKFYDVAIRKEFLDKFLADIKQNYKGQKMEGPEKKINNFGGRIIKLMKRLVGLKEIDMELIKSSGKMIPVPYMYVLPLGTLEDHHNQFGDEEL